MNGNKIITVVLVLAPYLLANAGDVLITSTTSTNLAATDRRQVNIYTRDGHRILQTEKTSSLGGNGWVLQQSIIWQDKTAVQLTTVAFETGTSHDIRFNAVSGIDAIASWNESGSVRNVSLVATNDEILAGFTVVDHILKPIPMQDVEKSNAMARDLRKTFGRFIQKESTGDQFLGEIEELQRKFAPTNDHNQSAHGTH